MSGTVIIVIDQNDGDLLEESIACNDINWWRYVCRRLETAGRNKYSARIEDFDDTELRQALTEILGSADAERLLKYIPKGEYGYATLENIYYIPAAKERLL